MCLLFHVIFWNNNAWKIFSQLYVTNKCYHDLPAWTDCLFYSSIIRKEHRIPFQSSKHRLNDGKISKWLFWTCFPWKDHTFTTIITIITWRGWWLGQLLLTEGAEALLFTISALYLLPLPYWANSPFFGHFYIRCSYGSAGIIWADSRLVGRVSWDAWNKCDGQEYRRFM